MQEWQYRWYVIYHSHTKSYYARTNTYERDQNGKRVHKNLKMHMMLTNADQTDCVDHRNHNTLDNRKDNLRVTKNIKNTKNRKGKNSNNKSGYRNVSWCKWKRQWMVQLQVEGKNSIVGYFDDVHAAGVFAEKMREKYYGEYRGSN